MPKIDIRGRMTALRNHLAYTPCQVIDVEPEIKTFKNIKDVEKWSKIVLKMALGEASLEDPVSAARVMEILKNKGYL
jgi:hypothetical protein